MKGLGTISIGTLFAAILAVSLFVELRPLPDAGNRLATMVSGGTEFSSVGLEVSTREQSFIGRARAVKRLYQYRRQRFILSVIDGSGNRHAVHDPAFCIIGSGWKISSREVLAVENGEAELLKLQKSGRLKEALYWFSEGDLRYRSPLRYWYRTALRRITFGHFSPEPVLVILQSLDGESIDWRLIIDGFGLLSEI